MTELAAIDVHVSPSSALSVVTIEVIGTNTQTIDIAADGTAYDAAVVTVGIQGPEGAQGPSGDATSVLANVTLGGDRAITVNGLHCDGTSITSLASYAGITLTSATSGSYVVVKRSGAHTVVGATFTVGQPVYIGPNGTLVQTLPSAPIRRIGWATTTDTINLDPFPTIGA